MEKRLNSLLPLMEKLFQLSGSPGLSFGVLHEGTPVSNAHFGRTRASAPATPTSDTLYNVASLTKLMTADVVASLVSKGLLEWDVPVRRYLPEFGERQDEIPRLTCHIPAYGEFRKTFAYSTWGYGLVTCAIERVTGKPFSACVEKYLLEPLGMQRSTTNLPQADNVVHKHWVDTSGAVHEFPWSNTRGWHDGTGLGGAVGARSSIAELLLMYQSLLHAYAHQTTTNTDATPNSPFKFARRILAPYVGIGAASPEQFGYALGMYRTQLPANLSAASYNVLLRDPKTAQQYHIGAANPGRVVYYQAARFMGYTGCAILDPASQSGVVVLVDSLPLFDISDFVAQIVLAALVGEAVKTDYLDRATSLVDANKRVYHLYDVALAKKRTEKPPSFPLAAYEGEYANKDGLITYSVRARGETQLLLSVKGSHLTTYPLTAWDADLFCLVPDRVWELEHSIWPLAALKSRLFRFECDGRGVRGFTWHHDVTPGSGPETFVRERGVEARL